MRRQNGLLSRELLQFAEIQLPQEMEPQQLEAYQHKKGQLQRAIEERRHQIEQLKAQRKAVAKHISTWDKRQCGPYPDLGSINRDTVAQDPAVKEHIWLGVE
jgi:hypothetical protein